MSSVKKWNMPRGTSVSESPGGEFVLAADYAALEVEIEKLRAELAAPVQQAVPDVSAMARTLADRSADACNVNREDNWAIHGQDYIDDVTAMLAECRGLSK